MKKIKVYNSGDARLKENFYEILNDISEISTPTIFTKEQEEKPLKVGIEKLEHLKSGIDIKSSEILRNNEKIPFSGLEKIHTKFSRIQSKDKNKTSGFHTQRNEEGKPVKIYEFQKTREKRILQDIQMNCE